MKKIYSSFYIVILALGLSSCEKVIDLNLNTADEQIVIEGNVTDEPGPYLVKLTKSVNFDQSNSFPPVTSAFITIHDDAGNIDTLSETTAGNYYTHSLVGTTGRTYSLDIKLTDGRTFSSTSKLPQVVTLDSAWVEAINFGGTLKKNVFPKYKDPIGLGNYYRLKIYVNGEKSKNIYVQDDTFSDDLVIIQPLIDPDSKIVTGDSVVIELNCNDEAMNRYWFSLDQTNQGQSATPANPVNNINGKALGYFSAHTVSRFGFTAQ